jgi:hypothetical protein
MEVADNTLVSVLLLRHFPELSLSFIGGGERFHAWRPVDR